MKKRFLLAIAALSFTATLFAQDYMVIDNHNGKFSRYDLDFIKQAYFMSFEAQGSGTEMDPFNVAAANAKCKGLGELESTEKYYIKGIVAATNKSYYNGEVYLYIADDSIGINRMEAFLYNSDGTIPANYEFKRGDEIVVYGNLFMSGTMSMANGKLISINGKEVGYIGVPTGTGTATDPYNIAAIINETANLNDGEYYRDGAEVHVTGIVTQVIDISTQYGNATYYISDDANGRNKFYVYRGKMLNGANVAANTDLEVGDSVTVYGKIKNYKGTLEFDQGNYLTFLIKGSDNGNTPDSDEIKTVSIAQFLAAEVSNDVWYKLTGKVKNLKDGDKYGNFYLEDENDSVYVYGLLSEKNGEKKKFQELVETMGIKEGSKITIIGNRGEFRGVVEVMNAYFVSMEENAALNEGNGTVDYPYSVTEAIAVGSGTGVYVKAFIVGNITGAVLAEGAHFDTTGDTKMNLLIADSPDETDVTKCMPIQLPNGDIRNALNLVDNPTLYKKEVTLYGNIEKYFGTTGLKSVSFAILNGTEIGTKPDGGEGGGATAFYSIDFKATGSKGDWTIDTKSKDDALTDVWTFDSRYGMKASAFANSTCYASEAWLVSPAIDLSKATKATLKLHQALNKFSDLDASKTQCKVLASTDGNTWTELSVTGWPESLSWTYVDSSADLAAFAGKNNVKIALKYTSSTESAGTWEVDVITVE